jgi:predicted small lipoprotein YifL
MRRAHARSRRSFVLLALLAVLGACGQKGALYLPEKPQPVEQEQDRNTTPGAQDDVQ